MATLSALPKRCSPPAATTTRANGARSRRAPLIYFTAEMCSATTVSFRGHDLFAVDVCGIARYVLAGRLADTLGQLSGDLIRHLRRRCVEILLCDAPMCAWLRLHGAIGTTASVAALVEFGGANDVLETPWPRPYKRRRKDSSDDLLIRCKEEGGGEELEEGRDRHPRDAPSTLPTPSDETDETEDG